MAKKMKDLLTINHQPSIIIGIDGNEANIKNRVGSNVYAFQILENIWRIRKNDLKFKIFLKDSPLSDLPRETQWWQYKVLGPGFLWTQWRLPLALRKEKLDVFFSPGHYGPSFSPVPLVVSVLDVSYLRFPSQFRLQDLWQLRILTKRSVSQASRILTISQASKNDIMEYYGVDSDRIIVTYPGLNSKFQMTNFKSIPNDKFQMIKNKYKISGDYFIFVGTLQPRKNLIRLIEAFEGLKDKDLQLVIVGKKGWLYEEIFEKVKDLGLEKQVIFTGFVPDEELPYLIKGAIALILVSLYEGFGLPVAEAMSLGVPVVTSNVSSLPEIAGKAGILVDPYKIEEIAQGMEEVIDLYRNKPEEYKKMVEKGLEQAKKFSWEKCAQETLKVLKEAANVS